MNKFSVLVALVLLIILMNLVMAQTLESGGNESTNALNKSLDYALDRIIVKFQSGVTEEEKIDIIELYNSSLREHYEYSYIYVVNIPERKTVEEMVELFQTNPKVMRAYPDRIAQIVKPETKTEGDISEDEKLEENIAVINNTDSEVVLEEEKLKFETPSVTIINKIKGLEAKNIPLWLTIFIFILFVIIFLILKFRKR